MAPSTAAFLNFSPHRMRSYVFRLPLATRLLVGVITCAWIAGIFLTSERIREWGQLKPSRIGLSSMHRFNTYPLIHLGVFHALLNVLALTPLLERFEGENGTLITLSLFTGPFGLLPGILYVLVERFVLRSDTAIMGASIWVFLLLSCEAIKTYKANPHFALGPYKIPTWTSPLILILTISFLVPGSSLLGHLCGAAIGYLWALSYLRILAPPDRVLRFIEAKLNLLGRLPHYVSVDQKTYGRYGVLPSTAVHGSAGVPLGTGAGVAGNGGEAGTEMRRVD
ncbi:hypothetical protein BDY21DRAFT_337902 [Lineolata rhizophorae]|uniref:rhomboid protease n=1 Tax=Lineolata rhizophorae TaxID=578093 RepID=A0A6A6P7A1_9PEZI|nr:hypothetical protein BDY21DRAFT_337902 [Lineolata rhizophorae]